MLTRLKRVENLNGRHQISAIPETCFPMSGWLVAHSTMTVTCRQLRINFSPCLDSLFATICFSLQHKELFLIVAQPLVWRTFKTVFQLLFLLAIHSSTQVNVSTLKDPLSFVMNKGKNEGTLTNFQLMLMLGIFTVLIHRQLVSFVP